MALSDRGISALKPQEKDSFVADGRGLYLRVHTSGTKTFMYRSRVGGKARWVTMGEYPLMTLAEARRKALELATGMLPSRVTVQTVYDEWLPHINKTYKSPAQVAYRVTKHFLPRFADRLLAQITRAEISKLLTEVAAKAPVMANRVLADIKLLFSYAVERGWIESSPAHLITQRTVGGKEVTRDRVLTVNELAELICILRSNHSPRRDCTTKFDPATRLALALALLTGQRSNEIRSITRAQVKGRQWFIPVEITKTSVPMQVQLPRTTALLVRLAFKEFGTAPFKSMEGQSLSHATRYMKFEPTFRPHDLRRTMATHMADLGVGPHVIEKCLNHTLGGVMAIYNRSEYVAEKKAAWRLWERHLLRIAREAKKKPPALRTEG